MSDSFIAINRNNIRDLPRPNYIEWLISEEKELPGVATKCYELRWETDETALESWALHVRRHYIRDDELYEDCKAYGKPIREYLQTSCIPTHSDVDRLGPSTRSGDFAEIIISDMLQFIEGLTVPRYKQIDRTNPNSSDQGSDVIGYKVTNPNLPRNDDTLLTVEVKAKLTDPIDLAGTIAKAAKDSKKDDTQVLRSIRYRYNGVGQTAQPQPQSTQPQTQQEPKKSAQSILDNYMKLADKQTNDVKTILNNNDQEEGVSPQSVLRKNLGRKRRPSVNNVLGENETNNEEAEDGAEDILNSSF